MDLSPTETSHPTLSKLPLPLCFVAWYLIIWWLFILVLLFPDTWPVLGNWRNMAIRDRHTSKIDTDRSVRVSAVSQDVSDVIDVTRFNHNNLFCHTHLQK